MNDQNTLREQVREGYAAIAENGGSCCTPSSCCGDSDASAADVLAVAVGYEPEELEALPEGANMGLSCGNPSALAALKPGEVVLDLGSGGGFDVFIAGRKVGATGRSIGVDMTGAMLDKARNNVAAYRERTGLDNVEFRLGEIEYLPVADNSVDVIISNCVINLSPDKPQVWREIARVLKPGGRVAVSDLALVQPLPENIKNMLSALVGCIAGAVTVEATLAMAQEAGLADVEMEQRKESVDELIRSSQDQLFKEFIDAMPEGAQASDYVVSLALTARKPAPGHAADCCGQASDSGESDA